MAVGRFAPTPSGDLHVGNLRTAIVAWLFARSAGSRFVLRVEDLDPSTRRDEVAAAQLADLRAVGLDWDEPVVHQRDRIAAHLAAIGRLEDAGLTYPCYCTRREILEASAAPTARRRAGPIREPAAT